MTWESYVNDKLRQRSYQYRIEAKKDIIATLKTYTDLQPKEEPYVTDDGQTSKILLCLTGTIPVTYKGGGYNIPIQIWILHAHPHQAPLVYVKPTSTMVVKPNRHVDDKGRVYLPFLTEWSQASKSDLNSLIDQLRIIFGQVSPVYAKSSQPPPRPSYTPYPVSQPSNYPVPHGGMPMPHTSTPAGYPQHHPAAHPGYPNPNNPPYPTTTPYSTSGNTTQYPMAASSYPSAVSATPYPTSTNPLTHAAPTRQGSVIDEGIVRKSLLSAAELKLKQRIREVFEMGRIEQDQLQLTKTELESGNKALTDMITKMKDEQENLEANISLLEQKNTEIDDTLKKLENDSENMNIDEAVVTTAPLYNQILDLFAEESAIEDAIYYLSEGLRREAVDLEMFLRHVRMMSRKQFMLRATLLKARETARL